MNVFLLVEEFEQDIFFNKRKEPAAPFSSIVGVYDSREKAEREKINMETFKEKDDLCTYLIEERPIL